MGQPRERVQLMASHKFTLASGREVGVSSIGDPLARRLVVFCHPVPGAGHFDPDPLLTSYWGIHIVMIDRPGSGASDPLPSGENPSFERCADDIAEYLAHAESVAASTSGVRFGTIGVVGWATGGAVALSLAARHPGLVDRLALVGMSTPSHDGTNLWSRRRRIRRTVDATPIERLGADESDPDLRSPGGRLDGARGRIERMVDDAYSLGDAGIEFDLAASRNRSWSDALRTITAETVLAYGERDPLATSRDGRWYRRLIPNARVVIVQDAGGLALLVAWRRILEHVAPDHGHLSREDRTGRHPG